MAAKRKQGGWFRSYDKELEDGAIEEMTDLQYRVWRYCLNFCSRSPWLERRRGRLFHKPGLPVTARNIAARIPGKTEKMVQRALEGIAAICPVSPILRLDSGVISVVNWRRRQYDDDEDTAEEAPEYRQNTARIPPKKHHENDAIDLDRDVDIERDSRGVANAPPAPDGCGWCLHPKGPDSPTTHLVMQFCHDTYREQFGRCPKLLPNGAHGKIIKGLVQAVGEEQLREVWRHYLKSQDGFIRTKGHSIEQFSANFDGVANALKEGQIHGATQRNSGARPRANAPSSRDEFGPGGPIAL